ncbi:MAG: lipoprotein-releasing ABC transporter permease subunit [bacterium]
MFKPLPLFIGQRYIHAKRQNHYVSFISMASMLGIMIGVFVLISILSIMHGFEKELRARILGVVAHVTVSGDDGLLKDWQKQQDILTKMPEVQGAAPYIQDQVMIASEQGVKGALLFGISPEHQDAVSSVNQHMLYGSFADLKSRGYGIALGRQLADTLQVYPGDKVTLITPQIQVTPAGLLPRMRRFTVIAVYEMGMLEYDDATAFIHIDDASRLFKTRESVHGLRLNVDNVYQAPKIAEAIERTLTQESSQNFKATDWTEDNKTFFSAIKMEQIAMSIILFFIILIAIFNLLASLVMVVTDKQADIAILRTMGLSPANIRYVFMIQGSLLGIGGTLAGVLLGVTFALNIETIIPAIENFFNFKIFPADVYYISEVPSDLHASDVWIIGILSIIFSIASTIYPANRAAKLQPAESLRYE